MEGGQPWHGTEPSLAGDMAGDDSDERALNLEAGQGSLPSISELADGLATLQGEARGMRKEMGGLRAEVRTVHSTLHKLCALLDAGGQGGGHNSGAAGSAALSTAEPLVWSLPSLPEVRATPPQMRMSNAEPDTDVPRWSDDT